MRLGYFLALLCRSVCSLGVNNLRFAGSLFRGFRFLWCISRLPIGCFLPVLSDLHPLRRMISSLSFGVNSGIEITSCRNDYSIRRGCVNSAKLTWACSFELVLS